MRIYSFLSIGSIVLAAAGGIIEIIGHFVLKDPRMIQCIANSTGTFETGGWFGNNQEVTYNAIQAADYCSGRFSRNTWTYIIWLFAVSSLSRRGSSWKRYGLIGS